MGMRSLPILRGLAEEAQACVRHIRHFSRHAERTLSTFGCSAYRNDLAVSVLIEVADANRLPGGGGFWIYSSHQAIIGRLRSIMRV